MGGVPYLADLLLVLEFGLLDERIDERRLAVVDVRNDRDIPQVAAHLRELLHLRAQESRRERLAQLRTSEDSVSRQPRPGVGACAGERAAGDASPAGHVHRHDDPSPRGDKKENRLASTQPTGKKS